MIALHADQIYCGRYSLVGSIGAIVLTWDVHQLLDRLSIKRRVYASGELKSMLDPYMEPSDASNAKAQALVNNMGQFFLNDLKRIRGTKLQQNMNYGTGEVWTGEEAKNVGLVDGIGTLDEVIQATWHVQSHDFSPHHGMFSLFSDMQVAFSSALLNWTAPTSY